MIGWDKLAHFICGLMISAIMMFTTLNFTENKSIAATVGISSGIVAGLSKEIYDLNTHGTFCPYDLGYTAAGSLVVPILYIYFIEEEENE